MPHEEPQLAWQQVAESDTTITELAQLPSGSLVRTVFENEGVYAVALTFVPGLRLEDLRPRPEKKRWER